ncbi:MAG: WxcM-like domain-containing protein [Gammaproteobacteria bacterium]|nr:WxcM-like domain-containing protein [Gammaproteobacteria bacterium]
MSLEKCYILDLPRIDEPRGNLTFIEGGHHIPFDIRRIYYLHDIPANTKRGGHAHKELHQLIIAMSGSFDIHLDDGYEKKTVCMDCCYYGLYVCPMTWREIDNFSPESICMVLASSYYDELDYYRDYRKFVNDIQKGTK